MKCQVPGCENRRHARGLCDTHSQRLKRTGQLETTRPVGWGTRNKHPLNHTWRQARQRGKAGCIPEWNDFWQFVRDVGKKPEGNYSFRRIDGSRPYGPDNFYWREAAGSSKDKNEYMREWRKRNPLAAKHADLQKTYGIGIEDYYEMLESQGGGCKICGTEDTGRYKFFSVDHCHDTKKVRGLLCSDCNHGLGSFKDSPGLLDKAKEYLNEASL